MPLETNSPSPAQGGSAGGVGNPGGSIQEAMDASRNRLSSAYESVQQRSNEMLEGACGYVEQHPLQSLIYAASIGAVVGLVAGLMLGERSGGGWHKRWW
jgi:hypothetical protein